MIKRTLLATALLLTLAIVIMTAGCNKEKIVEDTQYVHDIEYVTLPPDTIIHFDTVRVKDSVTLHDTDTIIVRDTVIQNHTVHDTVVVNHTVYDTVVVNHTVTVHDTVTTVQHHYDTVQLVDTVVTLQCNPNEQLAFSSMETYVNALVIDFINQQFGYTDGWVFYVTQAQSNVVRQSDNVYDLYGYIDYWTPDWSGYYPLEFGYRMTFSGGDPSVANNWQITEAPATGSPRQPSGIRVVPNASTTQRNMK